MIRLKVCPFDEKIGVLYQSNGYYGLIAHHLIKGYKTRCGAYEFLRKRYTQYRDELKDAKYSDEIEVFTHNLNVIQWQMDVLETIDEEEEVL